MIYDAYWFYDRQKKDYLPLSGAHKTEVAIVGGGLTGLNTAYHLARRGLNVTVIEKDTFGFGTTGHSSAKLTALEGDTYQKMVQKYGAATAKCYQSANLRALDVYEKLISEEEIHCDFLRQDSFVYTTEETNLYKLQRELSAAKEAGLEVSFTTETALPFPVKGAIRLKNQASLHPIKYVDGLLRVLEKMGVSLFEHTMATDFLANNQIVTENGCIKADNIVLCTRAPLINAPGYYFARAYPKGSYLLACEGARPLTGMYLSLDEEGFTLRQHGDLLLFGGYGHKTGSAAPRAFQKLEQALHRFAPEAVVAYAWFAEDYMSADGLPKIGLYSKKSPHLYTATGFHKWGFLNSMTAALRIADLITDKKTDNDAAFSSLRFDKLFTSKDFLMHLGRNVAHFTKTVTHLPLKSVRDIPPGEGGIVRLGVHKVGFYNGSQKVAVKPYCTHLGCELSWNANTQTWDCPCHGSRFAPDGKVLEGPAVKPLERVKIPQE